VGSIRLVFSHPDAREVGLAEAMREAAMEEFRRRDITRFDAHVLPGHRLAKNFFEAGGFSARSIIMHHDDHPTERPGRDPRRF
jgi:ribosomal protein S18 acetylase RimI-like enzyme